MFAFARRQKLNTTRHSRLTRRVFSATSSEGARLVSALQRASRRARRCSAASLSFRHIYSVESTHIYRQRGCARFGRQGAKTTTNNVRRRDLARLALHLRMRLTGTFFPFHPILLLHRQSNSRCFAALGARLCRCRLGMTAIFLLLVPRLQVYVVCLWPRGAEASDCLLRVNTALHRLMQL